MEIDPVGATVLTDHGRAQRKSLHEHAPASAGIQDASLRATAERVCRLWDYGIFLVFTAMTVVALLDFLQRWFVAADESGFPMSFWFSTLFIPGYLAIDQLRWLSVLGMRRPEPVPARPGWKVAVATTFVPGVESLNMLEETAQALLGLEYPHDTWVLDEGDDAGVGARCHQLGARHFTRKHLARYQTERGQYQARTKYGNCNAWLADVGFASYEIIAAVVGRADQVSTCGWETCDAGGCRDANQRQEVHIPSYPVGTHHRRLHLGRSPFRAPAHVEHCDDGILTRCKHNRQV